MTPKGERMREVLIDKFLKEYGETGTEVTDKNPVYKIAKTEWLKGTELRLYDMRRVEDNYDKDFHYVLQLTGGNNGIPDWPGYLRDILTFIVRAGEHHKAWLIELKNDCPDDVVDVYIGLRDRR